MTDWSWNLTLVSVRGLYWLKRHWAVLAAMSLGEVLLRICWIDV